MDIFEIVETGQVGSIVSDPRIRVHRCVYSYAPNNSFWGRLDTLQATAALRDMVEELAGREHVWAEGAKIVPSDDLERDDGDDDSYFSELVVETLPF